MNKQILFFSFFFLSAQVLAGEQVISQKNKQFEPKSLNVKVGESITFKNDDTFNHNVFSLSDTKMFDLGSYPGGASKSVKFDKAGTVEVECAIHPDMKMTIQVSK